MDMDNQISTTVVPTMTNEQDADDVRDVVGAMDLNDRDDRAGDEEDNLIGVSSGPDEDDEEGELEVTQLPFAGAITLNPHTAAAAAAAATAAPPARGGNGRSFRRGVQRVVKMGVNAGRNEVEAAHMRYLDSMAAVLSTHAYSKPTCSYVRSDGMRCVNVLKSDVSRQRGVCPSCYSRQNNYDDPEMVTFREEMRALREEKRARQRAASRARYIAHMRALRNMD